MYEPDELAKREEDRINRTLNNVGRRGARPLSWNVPSASSHNTYNNPHSSNTTSALVSPKRDAIRNLQELIKEDERKYQQQMQQQQQQQQAPQQVPQQHVPQQQVPQQQQQQSHFQIQVQHSNGHTSPALNSSNDSVPKSPSSTSSTPSPTPSSGPEKEFLDADKDRKARQEEERLERWMRKGGSRFDDHDRRKSIDGAISPDFAARFAARSPSPSLPGLGIKFQDQIVHASKALRSRKSEDLARWSYAAINTARSISELVAEDGDILGYVKALEAGTNSLRSNLDGGGDGTQFYYEISGYLGQLYIATIGAV